MVEYVVYYRVSTERQGRSGLGLDAQRSMVERFLQPVDKIAAEFTEIESGKNDKRLELWKAINLVKKTKGKLLIPKLDRFSRKVSFISGIIDQGVELVVCEHPNVSTFFLHLLACFAEEERRQIQALHEVRVACSVNDVISRADPDDGKWFAIIVLDTDTVSTLLHARKCLPDFRVIGEMFSEKNEKSQVSEGARRLGRLRSPDRIRHLSS